MPIYEEKIICPLAVRFTQEHVRPVFQDGGSLDAVLAAIGSRPGTGDYDVILEAPFPNIEIVRWHQKIRGSSEPEAKHWFTLDNRRLYCLQRAAMALWPRRVGAVVEVLYSATDDIRRKDDSSTAGCSVGIGHSHKMLVDRWDWREAIPSAGGASPLPATVQLAVKDHKLRERLALDAAEALEAMVALVEADDARTGVAQLVDAPAQAGMLDLFLQGASVASLTAKPPIAMQSPPAVPDSEESTAESSTPRGRRGGEGAPGPGESSEDSELPSEGLGTAPAAEREAGASMPVALRGLWLGGAGDTYVVRRAKASWTCVRTDAAGNSKAFTLWHDPETDIVWWGTNWSMYLEASKLSRQPGTANWYDARGEGRRRPRYSWRRSQEPCSDATGGKATREPASAVGAVAEPPAEPAAAAAAPAAARRRGARARRGGGGRRGCAGAEVVAAC